MILTKDEIKVITDTAPTGEERMRIFDLKSFPGISSNIGMFGHVSVNPGESVGYHVHTEEEELYYILSGEAEYDDNGKKIPISAGTLTYTPAGSGHGMTNTGKEPLCFIALEIKR